MPTRTFNDQIGQRLFGSYQTFNVNGTPSSAETLTTYANQRNCPGEVEHNGQKRDYKALIRQRLSATTVLNAKGTQFRGLWSGRVSTDQHWPTLLNAPYRVHSEIWGDIAIPISAPLPNETSLLSVAASTRVRNWVIMGFIKKAMNAQIDFQGGVALGELRETIHLIRKPLKGLRDGIGNYLTDIRKIIKGTRALGGAEYQRIKRIPRKRDRVRLANQIFSDTWLEYAFGWTPLVADIDDGCKALANFLYYRAPSKYVQFRAGEQSRFENYVDSIGTGGFNIDRVYSRFVNYEEKMYGVVSLENGISVGAGHALDLQPVGLDLRSLIPTVYELIPYSFLVDYFSNLNEIINAACFNRASIKWVNLGIKNEQTLKLNSWDISYPSNLSNYIKDTASPRPNISFESTFSMKQRAPYSGSLIPSLEFDLPGGKQLVNIAALVASARYTQGLVRKSLRL